MRHSARPRSSHSHQLHTHFLRVVRSTYTGHRAGNQPTQYRILKLYRRAHHRCICGARGRSCRGTFQYPCLRVRFARTSHWRRGHQLWSGANSLGGTPRYHQTGSARPFLCDRLERAPIHPWSPAAMDMLEVALRSRTSSSRMRKRIAPRSRARAASSHWLR